MKQLSTLLRTKIYEHLLECHKEGREVKHIAVWDLKEAAKLFMELDNCELNSLEGVQVVKGSGIQIVSIKSDGEVVRGVIL